jgi:nucleotide-binding universal stress UspA family protein
MSALHEKRETSPGRVLVAFDGSEAARRALAHAAAIVGSRGRITVVNVIPVHGVGARLETVSEEQDAEQRRLLGEARALLARKGVHADLVGGVGDPLAEILAAATAAGAGTIVIGQSRRRLPLRLSVGERLVRRASCDVLVVH